MKSRNLQVLGDCASHSTGKRLNKVASNRSNGSGLATAATLPLLDDRPGKYRVRLEIRSQLSPSSSKPKPRSSGSSELGYGRPDGSSPGASGL